MLEHHESSTPPLTTNRFLQMTWPGLLLVLLIEIASIAFISVPIEADAAEYLRLSDNLVNHGIYSYDGTSPSRLRQPVYPLFLALFYWLLGQKVLLVQIVQALIGLAAFVIIMKTYVRLFTVAGLRWAAVIVGAYFPLWMNCTFILTELLTVFLISVFLYTLCRTFHSARISHALITGAAVGVGILTRPIAFSLLLTLWLPMLFMRRHRARTIVAAYGAAFLVLLPWMIRNQVEMGSFTPLSAELAYHSVYTRVHNEVTTADSLKSYPILAEKKATDLESIKSLGNALLTDPLGFVGKGVGRMLYAWSYFPGSRNYFDRIAARVLSYVVQLSFLVIALIGVVRAPSRYRWLLLYPAASFSLVLIATEAISRSLLPVVPPLLLACAWSLYNLRTRFAGPATSATGQFT